MKKKKHSKEFKARVAMKNEKTLAQISSEYEIHSGLITRLSKMWLISSSVFGCHDISKN